MTANKNDANTLPNPRDIRKRLGLNQAEFWSKIGVTQSGGSRYESGRSMPRAVNQLYRLVYIEQVELESINHQDCLIINFLKHSQPEQYNQLKQLAEQSLNLSNQTLSSLSKHSQNVSANV